MADMLSRAEHKNSCRGIQILQRKTDINVDPSSPKKTTVPVFTALFGNHITAFDAARHIAPHLTVHSKRTFAPNDYESKEVSR